MQKKVTHLVLGLTVTMLMLFGLNAHAQTTGNVNTDHITNVKPNVVAPNQNMNVNPTAVDTSGITNINRNALDTARNDNRAWNWSWVGVLGLLGLVGLRRNERRT